MAAQWKRPWRHRRGVLEGRGIRKYSASFPVRFRFVSGLDQICRLRRLKVGLLDDTSRDILTTGARLVFPLAGQLTVRAKISLPGITVR